MNILKELDLTDTVHEELWREVHNTVQKAVTKTISQEKEMQEGKVVVWGGLTNIWEKKQGINGKIYPTECRAPENSKERKKAFLSELCKEIKENNRLEKTRDLFRKIGDTKGTLHAKMGTIKDRNGKDLTEAEDIKKRWQEHKRTIQKKF